MLFTIFCCISTGLTLYCILNRFNKRTVEIASNLAAYHVKKEMYERYQALAQQLAAKEREVSRIRERLKLHETASARKAMPPGSTITPGSAPMHLAPPEKKKPREGFERFEMTAPFTETAYNALLRATEVVKVEPVGM